MLELTYFNIFLKPIVLIFMDLVFGLMILMQRAR